MESEDWKCGADRREPENSGQVFRKHTKHTLSQPTLAAGQFLEIPQTPTTVSAVFRFLVKHQPNTATFEKTRNTHFTTFPSAPLWSPLVRP